jgi:polar amino acid transport system substrate-binding protein
MGLKRFSLILVCIINYNLATAKAASIDDIRARGVLIVGAKIDYPPYGFKDKSGAIVGFEPDLAADLAKQLGVSLKIVPALTANRIELLKSGAIDLVIATMSITEERRKEAALFDPPYYAAGAGILLRRGLHIEESGDLKGRAICAVDGNIYWMQIQSTVQNINAIVFKDTTSASQALLDGRCEALISNDNLLFYKKQSEPDRFKDYEVLQLIDIDPLLWGIAAKLGEENSAFGQFVSQAIARWHRSGFLLSLERKWLGSNTPLLKALNKKWTLSSSLQPENRAPH